MGDVIQFGAKAPPTVTEDDVNVSISCAEVFSLYRADTPLEDIAAKLDPIIARYREEQCAIVNARAHLNRLEFTRDIRRERDYAQDCLKALHDENRLLWGYYWAREERDKLPNSGVHFSVRYDADIRIEKARAALPIQQPGTSGLTGELMKELGVKNPEQAAAEFNNIGKEGDPK